jgi:hypothetical protein
LDESEVLMSWLSGWDKRIKLTIDNTKIDAALSHFPVTVILSSTHGDCVFDELTQDANRKKIAFTKSDGTTQLYGEIEKWDNANESAIIHVSLSGWSISSSTDTDFYMYYDVDHADNDTYIGDIDSTPGHSVWDSNFKFVCHLVDETTSTVKDSTSNGNDGTKVSANNPVEAVGKIGQAQDFSSDYINLGNVANESNHSITLEASVNVDVFPEPGLPSYVIGKGYDGSIEAYYFRILNQSGTLRFDVGSYDGSSHETIWDIVGWNTGEWHHIAGVYTGTAWKLYFDGTEKASTTTDGPESNLMDVFIGAFHNQGSPYRYFDGKIDESKISDINRSAAWIKATYNTLWDTLLTYGSEEVTFIPQIIMF